MTSKARYVTFRLVIQGQTMNHPSDGQTHTLWLLLYSTMVAMYTLYLYRSRVDNLTRCVVLATGILRSFCRHASKRHSHIRSIPSSRSRWLRSSVDKWNGSSFLRATKKHGFHAESLGLYAEIQVRKGWGDSLKTRSRPFPLSKRATLFDYLIKSNQQQKSSNNKRSKRSKNNNQPVTYSVKATTKHF